MTGAAGVRSGCTVRSARSKRSAGGMAGAADVRGCRSMRSAASNRGAGGMTCERCVFCYDTAGDLRSAGGMRSAGGVRGGSLGGTSLRP